MDPWSDAGGSVEPANEAGPSWSGKREGENEITNSKSTSSPTFQVSGPVDPWAENSAPIGFNIPSVSYNINEKRSSGEYDNEEEGTNSRNDFDPWGGGSVPMTTSTSAHDNAYLNKHTEDERQDEVEDQRDSDWQQSNNDRELADKMEDNMHITNNEEEQQQHTEPFDEDDPWGSGAQARRAKAEANAQRDEIIRLQEEAKGRSSVEQEEDKDQKKEAEERKEDAEEAKSTDDKDKAQSTTAATTASGGWRSFFTRSAAPAEPNNTSRAPSASDKVETEKSTTRRGSSEIKSVQKDSAISAPRLWQAPTLRTGHGRTGSNGTQGSGAKESGPPSATSPSDQGPGWEVKTKKQAAPSGGFIQGLLGSGQNKEGSALSRLGNPLQRPPVVSAQDADDDDDSGDVEDTGLEWDAGDSFEGSSKAKQAKPPPDLLSNDIPQESTVSRLFGRFRGKATAGQEDGKQQEDDLSWLENIGEAKGTASQKPESGGANEDDWLAFVEGKPGNIGGQPGQSSNIRQIPKAGENFVIPNLAKLSSPKKQPSPLGPPPRIGAPPSHANTNRPVGSTQYNATTSPDPDETFGSFKDVNTLSPNSAASYRDDPDSYDDALLKGNGQGQQRKKANFLSSFSGGGRPVKPYTFDDDEEEVRENSWSAFRDVPYEDAGASQYKDSRQSTLPPRSVMPTQKQSLQQQSQPIMRSNSGSKNYQAGILPPPPSNQRSVNANSQTMLQSTSRTSTPTPITPSTTTNPQSKTLSQGNTLTNDDLSFFENL